SYPGVVGGPVEVASLSGVPLIVTQRSVYQQSFNELPAASPAEFGTALLFAWYDSQATQGADWVLIGNPSLTATLRVSVTIAGAAVGSFGVSPGGRVTPTFPGVVGGPVELQGDQLFYASQRVVYGQSFSEHWAVAASKFATGTSNHLAYEWWAPWYDRQSFAGDWLILANPSNSTSPPQAAQARPRIQGGRRGGGGGGVTVRRGGRAPPEFLGVLGGPVRVVVTNQVPILVGQRTVYQGNFNEVVLTPPAHFGGAGASQERYFPWYDYAWAQGGA